MTEIRWPGPYIIEKLLPSDNCLVRKIATNKTQVLHRMRMPQFTSGQPSDDMRSKPQDWRADPKVSFKHLDLDARAWEFEYERSIFDAEDNNAIPPNSPEPTGQSDVSTEEMRNTPGTPHECFPEFFPQTEE